MAAIPRDAAALVWWDRPCLRYQTRSRSTLNMLGERFLRALRPPLSRRLAVERFGDSSNVLGRVPATPAGDVEQAATRKVAEVTGHVRRLEIKSGRRERIRQTCIRITRYRDVRFR